MRTSFSRYFLFSAFAALIAGGCAKHVAKKDDASHITAETAKQAPQASDTSPAGRIGKEEVPISSRNIAEPASTRKAAAPAEAPLETIYFDFDSFSLTSTARETLVATATTIKKSPGLRIRIDGHCDELGSDEYNLALGEKRANAARQYLATMGVPLERLSIISFGEEKPADAGHNEAAWTKNRRDEFVVVSQQK